MTEEQERYEIVEAEAVTLGTIRTAGPAGIIEEASTIAKQLANIVNSRNLYSTISGRKYVKVEGWTTLGAMLGVLPREVETHRIDGGWESTVELVRANDNQVIGRGSAICTTDEDNWSDRPEYAVRSMAITRATGKAYRLGFSWVMALAGYEPTPAEEMDGVSESRGQRSQRRPHNPYEDSDNDIVPFGKHKGKTWAFVLENHRDYLEWLAENSDYEPTLAKVRKLLGDDDVQEPESAEPETPDNEKENQQQNGWAEFWQMYNTDGKAAGIVRKHAESIQRKYDNPTDAIESLADAIAEAQE